MNDYKIYIELGNHNCIHKILSTAFYTEEELEERGAIYIDTVSLKEDSDTTNGQNIQNNYFINKYGKPIYDDEFIPNFKFDGSVIEVTPEKKEEWYKVPRRLEQQRQQQEETMRNMMLMAQQVSFLNSLPDDEASKIPYCYDSYDEDPDGFLYEKDMRREYKGQLYKCLQGYKKEKVNPTQNPDVAVSLWVLTYNEEWPQWKQPTGSHDAYNTGDKVSHNDHKYTSNIDGNTTEPGSDERWWTLVE